MGYFLLIYFFFFFNFMSNFLTYPCNYELEQNKSCGTMEDWLRKAEGEK